LSQKRNKIHTPRHQVAFPVIPHKIFRTLSWLLRRPKRWNHGGQAGEPRRHLGPPNPPPRIRKGSGLPAWPQPPPTATSCARSRSDSPLHSSSPREPSPPHQAILMPNSPPSPNRTIAPPPIPTSSKTQLNSSGPISSHLNSLGLSPSSFTFTSHFHSSKRAVESELSHP
jgi:hypothetical protein